MANEFVPAGLSAPGGNAAPVTAVPAGVQNASGTPLVAGTQITTDLLSAGIGSFKGDPSLIRSNNAIASTDMIRPFNVNNAGRGSAYPGPVATPRNANIAPGTANNAGYNQLMMELMQRIAQNGTLYQQLMQTRQQAVAMAQAVDMQMGTNYAGQILSGAQGQSQPGRVQKPETTGGESSVTRNAREEAASRAEPR